MILISIPVKPSVRIKHQKEQYISEDFGSSVMMKCESEAFPEPVLYWEGADGVVIANDTSKYRIDSYTVDT